jgi:hypothetical protein
MSMRSL